MADSPTRQTQSPWQSRLPSRFRVRVIGLFIVLCMSATACQVGHNATIDGSAKRLLGDAESGD